MPSVAQIGSTTTSVLQSLDECQRSFASHRKCVVKLKKIQKSDPKEFREAVLSALDKALLVFKREPCVERLFQFVTDYVSFSNENYPADTDLAVDFIRHLVPLTRAKDKAVRFRACQLVSKLLNR
jgi:condensin complex subunit 3